MATTQVDLTKKTPEVEKPVEQSKAEVPPQVRNLRYQRDKDREMVKGRFRFYEVPGGSMSFVFKAYKEDPVERYDLVDGQVYSLPLGVAKHLNKNGNYPVYEHIPGEPGVHTGGFNPNSRGGPLSGMKVSRKVQRVGFHSMDFMPPEDLEETPDLYLAELKPL